jgi:hypothetical protein
MYSRSRRAEDGGHPLMFDMWVIVRRLNLAYSASITLTYQALCGPQGEGDLRSPA